MSYNHWYFRHPAHEQIAQDRYYLKDDQGNLLETDIQQVFQRVVKHLTGIDPLSPEINVNDDAYTVYMNLIKKRLMPGGRILAQAGTRTTNLNNCFVLGFEDNRETISKVQHQHFMIQSQGGGTGFNISKLRPRWSWVRGNQARSCGSIGFTSGFSYWSSLIAQGGNRSGANLAMLEDWHPDLLDFIDWKSNHSWANQIQQFATITNSDGYGIYEWQNPYQWQQFNVSVGISDKFMKLLKDNPDTEWQLRWDKDPWGIWKFQAYGKEWEVTATDEKMATEKVLAQLPFFNKPVDFKLIKGPYNLTVKQWWQRIAKNAHEDGCPGILFIDRIRKFHNGEYFNPIEATNPCVAGDTLIATIDGPKPIKSLVGTEVLVFAWDPATKQPTLKWMRNIHKTRNNAKIIEIGFDSGLKVRCTPDHNFYSPHGKKRLASAILPKSRTQSVRAFAISKHEAEHNSIHYESRNISGFGRHGWKTDSKLVHQKISDGVQRYYQNHRAVSINNDAGTEDVYNGTVDDVHTYIICDPEYRGEGEGWLSGIVSANCGEQPLPANSVCCLGTTNIYYCMTEDGKVDAEAFKEAIWAGVAMLNYVTDVTKLGIKEIDDNVLKERRIGLGCTGWHDALIKAKLKYSSEEGRAFVRKWAKFLRDESYRASIELAKVDGMFPAFDFKGYSQSTFFKTLPKDIQADIEKYGIRNVTVNTIAPYGTTGTIMGTSTGCEPHFALRYKRNSRVGSFEDGCFDYIKYVEEHGEKDIPEYFESSHDISWEDHLKMQAVFSEYIDSSVSKTINLPNTATITDVKKAYELAYELGIKSTTIYRDGSKTQILETLDTTREEQRPKKIFRHGAPKRPEILPCDIHRTTVRGTPWIVIVGLFDGEPYEVFAGKQDKVELDDSISKGELVKVASGKYLLKAGGTKINVKSVFDNAEQAAMTRMISTNLRHGTDIVFIVQQLDRSEDTIVDFSKAIGRVLKKYIKEGQKLTRKCPNCSSDKIETVWEAGCEKVICKSCGVETSKCS